MSLVLPEYTLETDQLSPQPITVPVTLLSNQQLSPSGSDGSSNLQLLASPSSPRLFAYLSPSNLLPSPPDSTVTGSPSPFHSHNNSINCSNLSVEPVSTPIPDFSSSFASKVSSDYPTDSTPCPAVPCTLNNPPSVTLCRFATSVWQKDSIGHYLCQECGLYHQFNSEISRERLTKAKIIASSTPKRKNNVCINCGTGITSLWRRDSHGASICNACGLYYKLHHSNRPITLKKDVIQTRKRKAKTQGSRSSRETGPLESAGAQEGVNISQM